MSIGIVAVVAGGLAIGGAVASGVSKAGAISAEKAGVNSQEGLNISQLNQLASDQDIAKYQADFQEQAKVDPTYAALRTQGGSAVLNALRSNADPNSLQNKSLAATAASVNTNVAPNQSMISDLMAKAKEELAAGATLPPAFQAEMIRSGLAAGGAAGTGVAGEGATGVGVRTLLGSSGLQLEAQRQAQALALSGGAQSLEDTQRNALMELTQLSNNMNAAKAQLGGTGAALGLSTVPSIGLSGTQDVNMSIANTQLANQKKVQLGQLEGQQQLNTGSMISGILGGASGMLTGGMGGGGTTGVTGSSSTGGNGILGGLLSYFGSPSSKAAPGTVG
jgi:hypothetical protein